MKNQNINTEQDYKLYLKEMSQTSSSTKRVFYDTDVHVRYLSPIQGTRESGSLDVIIEKNIQAKLTDYQMLCLAFGKGFIIGAILL